MRGGRWPASGRTPASRASCTTSPKRTHCSCSCSGHRSVQGLNAYGRIVLALELEPHFRGQKAGRVDARLPPSMLTKGSHVDVRADIARVAGVSTGNVTKVKQILRSEIREVRECLLRARSASTGHGSGAPSRQGPNEMPCGCICTVGASSAQPSGSSRRTSPHTPPIPSPARPTPCSGASPPATQRPSPSASWTPQAMRCSWTRELYEALQQADR